MLPFEAPQKEVAVPDTLPFTFIDLFAGIGGFRIALEKLGGRCAYSSEWDRYSQKTYKAWFDETPHGDIRQAKPKDIPDHDILAVARASIPHRWSEERDESGETVWRRISNSERTYRQDHSCGF